MTEVKSLPVLLSFHPTEYEPCGWKKLVIGRGEAGWTLISFGTAVEAATFFKQNQASAMPCWKRLEVVGGKLMEVR